MEADATKAQREGRGETMRFERTLSRGAYQELEVLFDGAVDSSSSPKRPLPPRRLPSSPKFIAFSVTAETVLLLIAAMLIGGRP
jgi:hypothetical protein